MTKDELILSLDKAIKIGDKAQVKSIMGLLLRLALNGGK